MFLLFGLPSTFEVTSSWIWGCIVKPVLSVNSGKVSTVNNLFIRNRVTANVCLAGLLMWLVTAVTVPAALLDESATTTLSYTDFTKDLLIPLFDPSLGQLQSAKLTITGQFIGGAEYENPNAHPAQGGTLEYTLTQNLNVTLGGQNYLSLSPVTTATLNIPAPAAFDGILDYAGTSGAKFQGINTNQVKYFTYNTPTSLAAFVGTGQDDFRVTTDTYVSMGWSGLNGVWVGTYSLADVTVDMQYTYQAAVAAVPEPGLGMLFGLGLVGIAVVRYRTHKRDQQLLPTA